MYRTIALALTLCASCVAEAEEPRTIGTAMFEVVSEDTPPMLLELIIIGVACGSSAAEAGIEVGDRVIAINGHDILQKEITEYLRASEEVEKANKAILKVRRRSGIERVVTLLPTTHVDAYECGKPTEDS